MPRRATWLTALASLLLAWMTAGCFSPFDHRREVCETFGRGYAEGETFVGANGCGTCRCELDGTIVCDDTACVDGGALVQCSDGTRSYAVGEVLLEACTLCECTGTGLFDCRSVTCGSLCVYDGQAYETYETFPASDGCNTCSCGADGRVSCGALACGEPTCSEPGDCPPVATSCVTSWGERYGAGERFVHEDGCNECVCLGNGTYSCSFEPCGDGDFCLYDGTRRELGETFVGQEGCAACTCESGGLVFCEPTDCAPQICIYGEQIYALGEAFYDAANCSQCLCTAGGLVCEPRDCVDPPTASCRFGSTVYGEGDSVTCPDGCNTCTCRGGEWSSTDMACGALSALRVCGADAIELSSAALLYTTTDVVVLQTPDLHCGPDDAGYSLCWDGRFASLSPARVELKMVLAQGPACGSTEAIQLAFDVAPLRRAYQSAVGNAGGVVELSLGETRMPLAF